MTTTVLRPAQPAPAPVTDDVPGGAQALILATLETLAGRRPLHQLRPHLSERAFLELAHRASAGAYRRLRIGALRCQMPTCRAVEASVTLQCGQRWISCVIRLDARRRSWECTEFVVLAPRTAAA